MRKRLFSIKPSIYIAFFLALAATAWIWSGQIQSDEIQTIGEPAEAVEEAIEKIRVRVVESLARDHQPVIIVSGKTEEDRKINISAETNGRFVNVAIETGQKVAKGQIIAKLSLDGRDATVAKARALVAQRKLQYEAASKLADKGFQSRTRKSTAEADLSAARAELVAARTDLDNTVIVAPFDGIIKTKYVDIGDYAKRGDPVAELISLDPIYVTGHVAEKEVAHVRPGSRTRIRLITGQKLAGILTRVAPAANDNTRTFKIEVRVDNPQGLIQAGLTAELRLPLDTVRAHLVTPALLSLNDMGNIGVKTVDKNGRVRFNMIRIIENTKDGLWIAGLPDQVTLITVGQEYVVHGQEVETAFDQRPQSSLSNGNPS